MVLLINIDFVEYEVNIKHCICRNFSTIHTIKPLNEQLAVIVAINDHSEPSIIIFNSETEHWWALDNLVQCTNFYGIYPLPTFDWEKCPYALMDYGN